MGVSTHGFVGLILEVFLKLLRRRKTVRSHKVKILGRLFHLTLSGRQGENLEQRK